MMTRIVSLTVSVMLVCLLFACGRSPSEGAKKDSAGGQTVDMGSASAVDLVDQYLAELDKMATLFEQVSDEASAKEHAPAIQACSVRLQQYADRLGEMDKTATAMAFSTQTQRFMSLQQKMMPPLARIGADPALAEHLSGAMKIPSIGQR